MIVILFFVLSSIPVCFGLLGEHILWGHDAASGLIRSLCVEKYWGNGQFLIRWAADINYGYGSPMFEFYPPFFSFFSFSLSKFALNPAQALSLAGIILWIFSGIGMYLLAKELWGNKGGLLSAIAYLYAPYHIQDLFVRGAFAEFGAFTFFPFLILSFYKIHQKIQMRYVVLGVLSVFLLSLTHNVMSMLFFPLVALYILFLFLWRNNFQAFLLSIFILAIGLMMSSFFWLPALLEKKFLNLSFLTSMRYDFHKNFVSWDQLLRIPWSRGTDRWAISFQIGLIPLILSLLPIGFIWKNFKSYQNIVLHYVFFLIVGFFAAFLTLSQSQIIWEHIHMLTFLQFPWRILAIGAFVFSLLAGSVMLLIKNNVLSRFFFVGAVILLIFSSMKFIWPPLGAKEVDVASLKSNLSNIVFLGEGEYTPKWIKFPMLVAPLEKFEVFQGEAKLSQYEKISPVEYRVHVKAMQPSLVFFHSFYFPGWRVFIDDKETPINPDNPYGLITFTVPSGEHVLRVIFGPTSIRIVAVVISWIGFLCFIGGLFFIHKFEKKFL